MQRSMSLKGFLVLLGIIVLVFLAAHLALRGNAGRKRGEENLLRQELARLQDEQKDLDTQLNLVGTDDYIISSARDQYSYVNREDIRFQYTNPDALYGYSEEEIRILLDELAE